MTTKKKSYKLKIISKFKINENDCGSSEVQIAVLSHEIKVLTEHMKNNKKDNHSKVGLIRKINRRKKLLLYLKRKNFDKYNSLTSSLSIRK